MGKFLEFESKQERLRNKLLSKGVDSLSDEELVIIMLDLDSKCDDAMVVAKRVVKYFDDHQNIPDLKELRQLEGIGPEEAAFITAGFELGNRYIRPVGVKIERTVDVLPLVRHYADHKEEYFCCISLNRSNEVIATRIVSVGSLSRYRFHPSQVFSDPLVERSSAVILARSRPSGDLTPNEEDIFLTRELKEAGEILEISVLDHIIFSRHWHYSFLDNGKLGDGY